MGVGSPATHRGHHPHQPDSFGLTKTANAAVRISQRLFHSRQLQNEAAHAGGAHRQSVHTAMFMSMPMWCFVITSTVDSPHMSH
jgi:hypothetical protein